MTIDNHIEILKSYYNGFTGWACNIQDSIDVAVDIMCKYQKIQEIYERFQKDGSYYHHMAWLDVMEVVEDGKDN